MTDHSLPLPSSARIEEQKNEDSSAELAAVGNDTGRSPTETASVNRIVAFDGLNTRLIAKAYAKGVDEAWVVSPEKRQALANSLYGAIKSHIAAHGASLEGSRIGSLHKRLMGAASIVVIDHSLAATQPSTEVSSTPAASPAQKENSHVITAVRIEERQTAQELLRVPTTRESLESLPHASETEGRTGDECVAVYLVRDGKLVIEPPERSESHKSSGRSPLNEAYNALIADAEDRGEGKFLVDGALLTRLGEVARGYAPLAGNQPGGDDLLREALTALGAK